MNILKFSLMSLVLISASVTASANEFSLTSPDIAEGQQLKSTYVFQGFGCEGANKSPSLSWSNMPKGTKSFALTVYDPDAPTGSGWWHWFTFNIPASTTSFAAAASAASGLPSGAIELNNDYGAIGFGGACPPPGEVHRYRFTIHALSVETLGIDATASNALAGYLVNANTIASSTITAVYTR